MTRDAGYIFYFDNPLGGNAPFALVQPITNERLSRAYGASQSLLGSGSLNSPRKGVMIRRPHTVAPKPTCWLFQPKKQNFAQDDWFLNGYRTFMSTLGTRLKRAREAAGLTQAELAKRVGLAGQQSIEAIEVGRSKNPTRIYELAKSCGVTVEWLRGDINTEDHILKVHPVDVDIARGDILPVRFVPEYAIPSVRGDMVESEKDVSSLDIKWDEQEPIEKWGLPTSYVERELGLSFSMTGIISIKGDSMDDGSSHSLISGDRVIVDRRDVDIRQGGIFAVFDGGSIIVKQVELMRDYNIARIKCKSLNKRYDPIELELSNPVKIVGRIVGVISRR